MKISEQYPSKYLKADDLQGREVRVTIANVELEKLGDDFRPVVYFKGKERGVVMNKTNCFAIAAAYGDDTEEWFGNDIILFSAMVTYANKTGPAIRVRIPSARDNKPKREDPISSGPKKAAPPPDDDMNGDSIPF